MFSIKLFSFDLLAHYKFRKQKLAYQIILNALVDGDDREDEKG